MPDEEGMMGCVKKNILKVMQIQLYVGRRGSNLIIFKFWRFNLFFFYQNWPNSVSSKLFDFFKWFIIYYKTHLLVDQNQNAIKSNRYKLILKKVVLTKISIFNSNLSITSNNVKLNSLLLGNYRRYKIQMFKTNV